MPEISGLYLQSEEGAEKGERVQGKANQYITGFCNSDPLFDRLRIYLFVPTNMMS